MTHPIDQAQFNHDGLIPCVMQDAATGEVLTLAWMNRDALAKTLETGQVTFWSRSRKQLWTKGETSGNTMQLVELKLDCDSDALVARVNMGGPACHTGENDCFFRSIHSTDTPVADATSFGGSLGALLEDVRTLLQTRKADLPEGSYSTYLFRKGLDKILKKIAEEAGETVIAAKNNDKPELVGEICDLVFHLLVLMVEKEISLEDVRRVMSERHAGDSGATKPTPNLKISRPEGCQELEERLLRHLDPSMHHEVTRALEQMYRSHAGQEREEGGAYATHPLHVALIAVEDCNMRNPNEVIAALLHDALEDDLSLMPTDVASAFGSDVAEAVVTLTKMYKRDGMPREMGLKRYYHGLRSAPSWVRAVKLCDRVHNLRTLDATARSEENKAAYRKETRDELLPMAASSIHQSLLKAGALLLQEMHR